MVETAHPAGFFSSTEHKVHFMLSVALETRLPLKEDQYTFMISVSSSVCVFRCVCVSVLETEKVFEYIKLCHVHSPPDKSCVF